MSHASRRHGFTLVELLVVIVIIGILISILVPAVGNVRNQAKVASTNAVFSALGTGIEAYRADGRIGGGLPPSASDADNSNGVGYREVRSPYTQSSSSIRITGAGLLTWALAGADRLGTPGFKTFRSGSKVWAQDTDAKNQGATDRGAYALDGSSGTPVFARSGPFVDISKVRMSNAIKVGSQTRFTIEAEVEAFGSDTAAARDYPMFLDGFGYPILYLRADPAGVQIADRPNGNADGPDPTGTNRGIYHYADLAPLVASNASQPVQVIAGQDEHKLEFQQGLSTGSGPIAGPTGSGTQPQPGMFQHYIWNRDVPAKLSPHRADSYLLISPGLDGLYGTGDDLANFQHNGQ